MAKKYATLRAAMPQEAREKAERIAAKLLAEIEQTELTRAGSQTPPSDSTLQMPFPPSQSSKVHTTAAVQ